jgi:hypothetical protein
LVATYGWGSQPAARASFTFCVVFLSLLIRVSLAGVVDGSSTEGAVGDSLGEGGREGFRAEPRARRSGVGSLPGVLSIKVCVRLRCIGVVGRFRMSGIRSSFITCINARIYSFSILLVTSLILLIAYLIISTSNIFFFVILL